MPATVFESAFADVIHEQAARDASAPAVTHDDTTATYGEFANAIDAAAAVLWHGWGVRPGDRVAWLGAAEPAQLVLLFALARIGAALLPLNFRLAPGEWDEQFAQCTPCALVHDESFAAPAGELAARHRIACRPVKSLQAKAAGPAPSHAAGPAPSHAAANAPALLVFTSGTTGTPKAAVHTQANLLANMKIAAQVQRIDASDVVATMLPLFHVGGLCIQTLPALGAGARVVLLPRFAPGDAFDALEAHRATLTLQVPATMKALIEHPRWASAELSSLRAVWAGSSVIPPRLVDAFHARGLKVCNVYGATETGPFSIALPPEHAVERAGSCGWPVPGVEARLASSESGDRTDRDGPGEVWLRGPNVVAHYWPRQPACDADGWFHTGDLARRDADGSYTIVGRAKDLIISGGENIHPGEIEAVLSLHPDVEECAAFGVADAQWGEAVGVAVVPRAGGALTEEALRSHLDGRIARFKIPRRWLIVDALPKTALGKVQRAALAQRAGSQR